jgi:hypothetical protein
VRHGSALAASRHEDRPEHGLSDRRQRMNQRRECEGAVWFPVIRAGRESGLKQKGLVTSDQAFRLVHLRLSSPDLTAHCSADFTPRNTKVMQFVVGHLREVADRLSASQPGLKPSQKIGQEHLSSSRLRPSGMRRHARFLPQSLRSRERAWRIAAQKWAHKLDIMQKHC